MTTNSKEGLAVMLIPICTNCLDGIHDHDLKDERSNCKVSVGGVVQCNCGMGGYWAKARGLA